MGQALEKAPREGGMVQIKPLAEAGDRRLNEMIRAHPQDKDVILQAGRIVRDKFEESVGAINE